MWAAWPKMVPAGKVGYVTVDPDAIAASLIDFFEHDRAAEFRPGLLEEKKKYAWSNMTRAVKEICVRKCHAHRKTKKGKKEDMSSIFFPFPFPFSFKPLFPHLNS